MATSYPLAGVRVLDLSRVLAGPVCTQLLADLGADVVKVERPGLGDDTRQWGPPFLNGDGPSAYFLSCNRGKRSLALELGHREGGQVARRLVQVADVLVENFRLDSLERLGLTAERLLALNPRLVSCAISGFGRTGPLADVPGYDLMIQACAGLMSITGPANGMPTKVGVAIADVITGLYAAAGVLAGLHGRDAGNGAYAFDMALADCTLASLVNVAQSTLLTGRRPQRYGNAHPQIVPYEALATSDGTIALAIGADRQWQRFCAAVGQADWASDARFATNPARVQHRAELMEPLARLMATRTTAQWVQLLSEAEVPHSPVLAVDEIIATPQAQAREMVEEVQDAAGRRYRLLGSPIHWHDEPPRRSKAPPELGEHTDEVLREWLAADDEQIAQWRASGAVA